MVDSKTEDLINRDIDGVLSPKETERLEESLANNPEALNYHNELITLSRMLDRVEEIDPGPNLKKNILNSIPIQKYQKVETQKAALASGAWRFRARYRITFAFAVGLIVGFFTYSFLTDLPLNNSNLVGTILSNNSMSKFRTIDQSELTLKEVSGTISTQLAESSVLFRIDLTSDTEIEVVVEFDGNDLRFAGFQPQKYSAGQINVSSNMLKFATKGRHDFVLVFEDKTSTDSKFTVKILSDKVLYEDTLETQKKD